MGTRSLSLPPCSRVLQRSCWESSQGCQKVISGAPLSGLLALGRVPPTRIHFQLQHPLEIGHMLQHLTEFPAIPGERQNPVTTALSRLPFRKHQCENTPLTGTL